MSETTEHTTERWTWAGARLNQGKLTGAWIGADGKERWYSGPRWHGTVIGGRYDAQVTHLDDARVTLHGTPVYAEPRDPGDDRAGLWAAEDRAARTRVATKARERRDAKQSALDDALEPLLAITGKLRTTADRDAVAAYVLRQINSSWAR
jgi:hypothetical protein